MSHLGITVGIIFLLVGGTLVVKAAPIARANDTKGPAWLRNYGYQAYEGRTSPWMMRIIGAGFICFGVAFFFAS
ncbi:hypothetical protein CLV35_2216 [Motilibacter peucedani]|uniref:Uncharacterized protein n=1 Tax=Motilibacter peucedani TaxID=598650 RepID=A0A420XNH1_9ACTN|nr:hypothetical protein CLV35_2216 [Motilibacter peucedani]